LPFGKHKGAALADVPTPYLSWLTGDDVKLSAALRAAVRDELAHRGVAMPDEAPPAPRVCHRCGCGGLRLSWHQCGGRGKSRQIRTECSRCRRFCGFVPQTSANVAEADSNARPAALLDVLTLADAEDVELINVEGRYLFVEPWDRASPDLKSRVKECQHLLLSMLPARRMVQEATQ
jgi:hypothetical protein